MEKKPKRREVGRVDYRLLRLNKSSKFQDKRTKRARTRGDSLRRSLEDE